MKDINRERCKGSQIVQNMEQKLFDSFVSELINSGVMSLLFCDGILGLSEQDKTKYKSIAAKYQIPVEDDCDIVEINTDVNYRLFDKRS